MKKNKGITLIEAIFATGIFLLLLGMLSRVFIASLDDWRKIEAEIGTQQQAMQGISKIFREIVYSNSASITILSSNYKAISFISMEEPKVGAPVASDAGLEDMTYDASPIVWKKFVIFYKEGNALKRKEIPCNHSSRVMKIRDGYLISKINDANYLPKTVADNIEAVEFSTPDYPSVDVEVKVRIQYSSRTTQKNKNARTALYMKFLPKN